ncbi:unnamed protein product [Timema podura]|uniref:Uncharacterized protein n=1 Tax=Timema podura TaxID=61482 RepID=A0ABN7NMB4_TIMPD|nr:unnamed protein product [Timema podura]
MPDQAVPKILLTNSLKLNRKLEKKAKIMTLHFQMMKMN